MFCGVKTMLSSAGFCPLARERSPPAAMPVAIPLAMPPCATIARDGRLALGRKMGQGAWSRDPSGLFNTEKDGAILPAVEGSVYGRFNPVFEIGFLISPAGQTAAKHAHQVRDVIQAVSLGAFAAVQIGRNQRRV